ncbi:MAG: hydroxymethylbilane synthase [Chloroflexota bacterium]
MTVIRLGTRGSRLALRQAELVRDALLAAHPGLVEVQLVKVRTEGDRVQDRPIAEFGDKGVFISTLEAALLSGEVDLAVHSLKDVPADRETPGLALAAFSRREDPREALVSRSGERLEALPPRSHVGTSSPRRRVLIGQARPDLVCADIRGNVDTRLAKLAAGDYDAIVLAAAGMLRLDRGGEITQYLDPETFVPDAGQGIMVSQARVGSEAASLLADVDDPDSRTAALAERAVVRALEAGCKSPVGAYARLQDDHLTIRAMAASEDGTRVEFAGLEGPVGLPEELGQSLGRGLREKVASAA